MTKMSGIGEKAFIRELLPHLGQHRNFVNGFGHDASVLDAGLGPTKLVMKIDRAASPIATKKGWAGYDLWGRIAVTSNCSDLLAVGGRPIAVMISLVLPGDWHSVDAKDIVIGCARECDINDVAFLGGDTKEGEFPQVVGSAIGLVEPDGILGRNGAKPGDRILVTGELGGFLGCYLQLEYEKRLPAARKQELLKYVCFPRARWLEANVINSLMKCSAAMDSSDGMFDVLLSFAGASMGARIDLGKIPYHREAINASEKYGIELFNFTFGVGDWNIFYTASPNYAGEIVSKVRSSGGIISDIGSITEVLGITAHVDGREYRVEGVVNEHFRSRMEDAGDFMDRIRRDKTLVPL